MTSMTSVMGSVAMSPAIPTKTLRAIQYHLENCLEAGDEPCIARWIANIQHALHPSLKVLYISGMEDQERLGAEIAGGRAWFLGKPFKTRELTEKADEILSRFTVDASR